jgi:hypothetical protein
MKSSLKKQHQQSNHTRPGAGRLEHVAQPLLKGSVDAVLAAKVSYRGKCTVRDVKQFLAKKVIPVPLRRLRRLYELLLEIMFRSSKCAFALLSCFAAVGVGTAQPFFILDIYFHK